MAQTTEDRRVRRTKALLHRAMASLLHEKSWDDIVVKEILGRADVGRSTFYTHFRDKDALLLSALRGAVRAPAADVRRAPDDPVERVLGFARPLLEHIERLRSSGRTRLGEHDYAPLHARLEGAIAARVAEELRVIAASPVAGSTAPPVGLAARQIASTFLITLEWWIGLPQPRPASDADQMFRSLARPVVLMFSKV